MPGPKAGFAGRAAFFYSLNIESLGGQGFGACPYPFLPNDALDLLVIRLATELVPSALATASIQVFATNKFPESAAESANGELLADAVYPLLPVYFDGVNGLFTLEVSAPLVFAASLRSRYLSAVVDPDFAEAYNMTLLAKVFRIQTDFE